MTRIQKCMGTWSASSSCQVRRGAWAAAEMTVESLPKHGGGAWAAAEMTAGCPFMI